MGKIIDFVKALEHKKMIENLVKDISKDPDAYFAEKFAFDVAFDVSIALHEMGYNIGEDTKAISEILMLEEVITSLVMRCVNKPYPLQSMCEDMFKDEDGNDLDYDKIMQEFLTELQDTV